MEELERLKKKTKKLRIVEIVLFIIIIIVFSLIFFKNEKEKNIYHGPSISNQAKEMFNVMFTMYEGSNLTGDSIKDLIRQVEKINNQFEHQILINNSKEIPPLSKFTKDKEYEVMCEYNNGYVCNIIITERSE